MTCSRCSGTGWVCEVCGTRWELESGETCCSPGKSCDCNPDGDYDFESVFASTNPAEKTETLQ